ncbi:MAG: hypothetical protein ABEI98_05855 [Halorhabdus sp.]
MVSIVDRLRQWLDDDTVVYECRNCGRTVEQRQDECPDCSSEEIIRYDCN